jgi:phage-related protein
LVSIHHRFLGRTQKPMEDMDVARQRCVDELVSGARLV